MAGRIEAIRFLCLDNNLEYVNEVVTRDTWADIKPKMMFGQLPCMKDGDIELVQSNAILRYLARKHDLYGSSDLEKAMIDIINDSQEDLRMKYVQMIYGRIKPIEEGKPAFLGDLPTYLEKFEKFLKNNNGGTGFFVGNKISFVDYNIFDLLDILLILSPTCLDSFPTLKAYHQRIGAREKIAKYMATEEFKAIPVNGNGKQ